MTLFTDVIGYDSTPVIQSDVWSQVNPFPYPSSCSGISFILKSDNGSDDSIAAFCRGVKANHGGMPCYLLTIHFNTKPTTPTI